MELEVCGVGVTLLEEGDQGEKEEEEGGERDSHHKGRWMMYTWSGETARNGGTPLGRPAVRSVE